MKIYLAINKFGISVKFIVTDRTHVNCKEAINFLKNIDSKLLFSDRAYNTNEILSYIAKQNMKLIILSKCNRLEPLDYNRKIYSFRHIIENTYLSFKCWHDFAIFYAKTFDDFLASIYVRCIFMCL